MDLRNKMKSINKFELRWIKQLVNNAHIGILVVDDSRRNLYVNRRLCDIFGYTEEELLSNSVEIFHINEESFLHFGEIAFNAVIEGKPVNIDYKFKKKDGTVFWVHISGDLVKNEKEILWSLVDVTQRKLLETEQYRDSQLIQQIQDGMVITDLKSNILDWNIGAENMLGYKKEDVLGLSTEFMYFPQDYKERQENMNELIEKGVFRKERRLIAKSKEVVEIDLTASVLKDIEGKPIGMLGYFKDITSRKKIQEQIEYLATHDNLTNLPNRMLFHDRLKEAIKSNYRDKKIVALFFMDLDYFKNINDSLGHEVGDEVLKEFAKRVVEVLRVEDTVSRLGGDEFTVILQGISHLSSVEKLAKKILEKIAEPMIIGNNKLTLSSSIGISIYPDDTLSDKDLLKYADIAMYKAKDRGRNNFQFYNALEK
jgi:diguanylate cyclase (GGDEF)-like protein/PAS domain S-box-containing protein